MWASIEYLAVSGIGKGTGKGLVTGVKKGKNLYTCGYEGKNLKTLHLNIKKEYFLEIKSRNKSFEFRLNASFWKKKLIGKDYDVVYFKLGYPKNNEIEKIVKRECLGYEMQNIKHTHFRNDEVEVFAIYTNGVEV